MSSAVKPVIAMMSSKEMPWLFIMALTIYAAMLYKNRYIRKKKRRYLLYFEKTLIFASKPNQKHIVQLSSTKKHRVSCIKPFKKQHRG